MLVCVILCMYFLNIIEYNYISRIMPLTATGPLKFSDIQTEFGGTNPISMSEYYKDAATGYASSVSDMSVIGTAIGVGKFRGKQKGIERDYVYRTPGTYTFTVPEGCIKLSVLCIGCGGDGLLSSSGGGGGAALIWGNFSSVSVGEIFTVFVGGTGGQESYFQNNGTLNIKLLANGGGNVVDTNGGAGGTYSMIDNNGRLINYGGGKGGDGSYIVYRSTDGVPLIGGAGGAGGAGQDGGLGVEDALSPSC